MKIKNELKDDWEEFVKINSDDDYSHDTIRYTIIWADRLERALEDGEKLEDVVLKLSFGTGIDITGFMHGMAASIISKYWVLGDQFRQAYNESIQIGNEGEGATEKEVTLNPALMTFTAKD